MSEVRDLLCRYVDSGAVPGAVALIDRGGRLEVVAVGRLSLGREQEITEDSIFRIASLTKPITAVAVMMLVEDGLICLDDPIARWLPELAAPRVVRAPDAPIEDTVAARRPITVFDLLTFRAGYGFGEDFSLPALQPMFTDLHQGAPSSDVLAPDEWISTLARIPMLHQPGQTWLYNTCSDIQGVLIARVAGTSLPQFLAERIFEPLGMSDTGFAFPAADQARVTSSYRFDDNGALTLADGPDGDWRTVPAIPVRRGRPPFHRGGLARVRTHAAGRRPRRGAPVALAEVGRATYHRPPHGGPAIGEYVVSRGTGLGFRRVGRRGGHR